MHCPECRTEINRKSWKVFSFLCPSCGELLKVKPNIVDKKRKGFFSVFLLFYIIIGNLYIFPLINSEDAYVQALTIGGMLLIGFVYFKFIGDGTDGVFLDNIAKEETYIPSSISIGILILLVCLIVYMAF